MTNLRTLITDRNKNLQHLQRSWDTAQFSNDDGIASMESLHQAGDSLVAVALLTDAGIQLIGSGVMVGPGLLLTATHVLDEFPRDGAPPLFMTFLPNGARAWLPQSVVTTSKPSIYTEERKLTSDLSVVSCTLNSDAHADYPLMLAPLQIALPLLGERLWAFGYRDGDLEGDVTRVTPLVSSGLVTAVFPHGRGERMPAGCIEVAMDTWGGMSGGPVVNNQGYVVGIVSSSFKGGPSYFTLIWDVLRMSIDSPPDWPTRGGVISVMSASQFGFVKLKGEVKKFRRGDVQIRLSDAEMQLLVESTDLSLVREAGSVFDDEQLASFIEEWSGEMEEAVAGAAIDHLERLSLPCVREFLESDGIPPISVDAVNSFSVEDFEGVEDFEVMSNWAHADQIIFSCAFDLLSVVWTIEMAQEPYKSVASEMQKFFINVEASKGIASMQLSQRCYFEAELAFDPASEKFTSVSIKVTGVHRRRGEKPGTTR